MNNRDEFDLSLYLIPKLSPEPKADWVNPIYSLM
jgi:hypothetical protein